MSRGASRAYRIRTGRPLTARPAQNLRLRAVIAAMCVVICSGCDRHGSEYPRQQEVSREPSGALFELVTSIPSPGASEPVFHQIGGMQLSRTQDELFVFDRSRNSVRAFDFAGRLIREFGGEGEGPNRFRRSSTLRLVGDSVQARDSEASRISWFSLEGEYLGSRTSSAHYASDAMPRLSHLIAVVRHDQALAFDARSRERSLLLLLDEDDRLVDTLFSYQSGSVYVRTRSQPDRLANVSRVGTFASEGYWMPVGDSVLVSVNHQHGIVEWYRIERGHIELLLTRNVGLTPRTLPITEIDVREQAAASLGIPSGEIVEVVLPEFEGKLISGYVVPSNLDVWVRRRAGDDHDPISFEHRWFRVPYDERKPVNEVTTPTNFLLFDAADDLLLGLHIDEVTEAQSVRVYRWLDRDG